MALDDFIAKNKIKGNFGKGGARGKGGDRRGNNRGRNDRGGGDRVSRSGDRGAVNKRGGGGFSSRRNRNLPDRWEHDMYAGGRANSGGGSSGGGNKLIVNNLDFGVTDGDMEELFAEFGNLKKASILYDRSGRSTGSAEIEFLRASDARQAKEQYHLVPLDGRAMNITVIGSDDNERRGGGYRDRSPRGRRGGGGGGDRDGGRNDRNGGGRRRGGGGGSGAGGGRPKKEEITQEQLDADMDEYLNERK